MVTNTTEQSISPIQSTRRNRRFRRSIRRHRNRENIETENVDDTRLEDFHPINLSSRDLSEAEKSILSKGPSFCPTPTDINWLEVHNDLNQFERRIRLAVYYHSQNKGQPEKRLGESRFQKKSGRF